MNKKIVRVCPDSLDMIDYHMNFTETVNKLLKSNNINFKLLSCSYGGDDYSDDWRILFELKKEANKL
jgi:hypothetical protein